MIAQGGLRPVHCAAPADLLESELFDHEKVLSQGPTKKEDDRIIYGGTLFLDEIGEIDASTQVKLLRFLETKSIERLGSSNTIDIDTRLVCATNRDLVSMIRKDEFREDLFYRLNVVTVELPPLRERGEDILLLIDHFLGIYAEENQFDRPKLRKKHSTYSKSIHIWKYSRIAEFCENLVVLKR